MYIYAYIHIVITIYDLSYDAQHVLGRDVLDEAQELREAGRLPPLRAQPLQQHLYDKYSRILYYTIIYDIYTFTSIMTTIIHTYTHTYMHTYIHTHIHTYTHTHTHTYIN